MNVLSLYAGIGGIDLGLEWAGFTTVGQVERDAFCLAVLAKHWPGVPRHDDVATAAEWWGAERRPVVDVVAGGFPCQPLSIAGKQRGVDDERWAWPDMARTIRALRPRFVFVENVTGILIRAMGVVLAELAACGYDTEWDCIPAAAVGAPHFRDRVWLIGRDTYADGGRLPGEPERDVEPATGVDAQGRNDVERLRAHVANPDGSGRGPGPGVDGSWPPPIRDGWWSVEPAVGRVAYGVPGGVDRLRALGNAAVPQVAAYAGRRILDMAGVAHVS